MKSLFFIVSILLLSGVVKAAVPVKMGLYDVVGGDSKYCYEELRQGPDHADQVALIVTTTSSRACSDDGMIIKFDCKKTPDSLLFCEHKVSDSTQYQLVFVNDSSFWQKSIQNGKVVLEVLFEIVKVN